MDSFYQIKFDTLSFSDQRMDEIRHKIKPIFDLIEIVLTINEASSDTEEEVNNRLEFYKINQPENYERVLRYYSPKYTLKNVRKFYQKLQDCRHKVEAAGYSLFLIKNEISIYENVNIDDIRKMPMVTMCPKTEFKNDVLIYETEAFLFHIKSSLDILIQALKYVYICLEDTKKDYDSEDFKICNDGRSILSKLNNSQYTALASFFENEFNLWIKDLIDLRNTITHRSGLENFFCFMFFHDINTLEKPKMPSGEYVDTYCERVYENLLILYKTVFEKFLLIELSDKINR